MSLDIINWENLLANQNDFQDKKPFKFTFVKNIFHEKFYEKLYEDFPKIDEKWTKASDHSKLQYNLFWGNRKCMNFEKIKIKIKKLVEEELFSLEPWIINVGWEEKLPKLNELR